MAYNTSQHLIQHRSKAPPIDLITIWQTLDNFRREILSCPTKCARRIALPNRLPRPSSRQLSALFRLHPRWRSRLWRPRHRRIKLTTPRSRRRRGSGDSQSSPREFFRETEVCEDDMAVGANENVFWFEIPVDDACSVQTFDSLDDFCGVEPGTITA